MNNIDYPIKDKFLNKKLIFSSYDEAILYNRIMVNEAVLTINRTAFCGVGCENFLRRFRNLYEKNGHYISESYYPSIFELESLLERTEPVYMIVHDVPSAMKHSNLLRFSEEKNIRILLVHDE